MCTFPCLYLLAIALNALNKSKEAIETVNKALSINPKHDGCYLSKGYALLNDKKVLDAIECFDYCIQLNPKNSAAQYNKAIAFVHLNKLDEALQQLEKCIQNDPKLVDAWYLQGKIYLQQGKVRDSLKSFEKVLSLNPLHEKAIQKKRVVGGRLHVYRFGMATMAIGIGAALTALIALRLFKRRHCKL